ncbi:FkbM family methyltransferase [Roseomonas xinghualingensis]|uniref:FkbM family methyltransferase n=1 Tax=Roseomonas xinghualingensis TaxID=2986475 RepID=UPI0021F22AD5|nr:FkbM family methyltransferase [Roseomonas sp. SXEYE001]MCV4208513.1 FkbM family methyltransferase [Roseomonas sp. SXEYE001]
MLAPLLHRMQQRVQTAVESSSVTSSVHDANASIQSIREQLENLEARIRSAVESASVTSTVQSVHKQMESLEVRLDTLRIGLDAVRLDAVSAHQELQARLDAMNAAQRDAVSAYQELQARLDAMNEAQRDAVAASREGQTELLQGARHEADLLRGRVNLLLQRVAIPLGEDVLVRTPEGFLLTPAEDAALLASLHESGGRLEPGTVSVMQALLQEGDLAVDVGANIGLTVLPAAQRVGPEGHVIAIEPASRVGRLLQRSLGLNGLSERVTLHLCAAGEAAGTAQLHLAAITGHSSLLDLPEAAGAEEVAVRTVDELVEPGRRVRLAKIDAEGFEPQVWRGMRRVIAESPELAVLVEFGPEHLRRAGLSVEEWLAEFHAPGFTAYEIDEVTGQLRPLRPMAELNAVFSLNLLLLRQPPTSLPQLSFA